MGVPTSEVGYTPAIPRREDHEVHKDMWGHWTKKKKNFYVPTCDAQIILCRRTEADVQILDGTPKGKSTPGKPKYRWG